ncbi:type VI secretion system ATPase TssH [Robbsia sp. Bb-Pol-6]|uniref:Type VI secretion system ATPase TssH n=1 Tax=Robbsia betulipollinis TaxID=2981849 RepID=A0ABT3ZQ77_9BURK|nr:type VI secretion system ATPase TssH [Robbsia betulipollinis]MCY0388380.1 type VI secretion system ATPase TssH [Robbsia betulipollinis]
MQIDIRTLLSRLDPVCKTGMEQAAELCVRQTHYNVEIEHLLLQLLRGGTPELGAILAAFDVKAAAVETQLQQAVDGFKRGNGRTPALAPGFVPLFQEAWLLGSMLLGEQQIRAGTLLLALLEVDALRGSLLESAPSLLTISREKLRDRLGALIGAHRQVGVPAGSLASGPGAGSAPGAMPSAGDVPGATRALDQFTVDLTRLAADGLIDPIRGRDAEIRQLVDVLLRRRQNNPILTGEAGVGKTAVVEGFAQRIADGDVPPALRGVCVRSLDLALLQAGAGVKGEFESRLKGVIAEVKASPVPIILFIDEAHQLIGAGGAEGQGDAANLLKPALARGELRTIAATTWAEYKKYVERDPALARRFQVVKVDEPQEDAAVDMLRGIVEKLARHHGVEVLDDAVRDAVRLSQRYISGRQLPDKAVSVLDTACARVAIGQTGVPERLEAVARDMAAAESQLRIWRHEAATGRDRALEMRDMAARLAESRAQHGKLTDKLAAERQVVGEITALRRRIARKVDTLPDGDGQDDAAAGLATQLNRLEKGLEAVQNDDAMVPAYVDSSTVASVISGWTGIPVGKMLADELHAVLHLKERLAERVVGQDAALDAIARRVRTSRADLDDPGKPVGVFLLVGPSGVGKTETGVALADALYGGERNLITVNLSEFQEAHSVSGLKGAPPGYVGYGRGGVLTEAVRRRPYSVILLDEMEKAHPDVLELFFQAFDKGTMEDGEGVTINFRNTLILMTSNAAQEVITHACRDGQRIAPDALNALLRPALTERFSPAFLGRLVLVPYYPLGDGQIQAIVALKLRKLAARFMRNHRARFTWTDAVARTIAARCTEVDSGARNIDHILTHAILPALSQQVLERIAMADPFDAVAMTLDADGAFAFAFDVDAGA